MYTLHIYICIYIIRITHIYYIYIYTYLYLSLSIYLSLSLYIYIYIKPWAASWPSQGHADQGRLLPAKQPLALDFWTELWQTLPGWTPSGFGLLNGALHGRWRGSLPRMRGSTDGQARQGRKHGRTQGRTQLVCDFLKWEDLPHRGFPEWDSRTRFLAPWLGSELSPGNRSTRAGRGESPEATIMIVSNNNSSNTSSSSSSSSSNNNDNNDNNNRRCWCRRRLRRLRVARQMMAPSSGARENPKCRIVSVFGGRRPWKSSCDPNSCYANWVCDSACFRGVFSLWKREVPNFIDPGSLVVWIPTASIGCTDRAGCRESRAHAAGRKAFWKSKRRDERSAVRLANLYVFGARHLSPAKAARAQRNQLRPTSGTQISRFGKLARLLLRGHRRIFYILACYQ